MASLMQSRYPLHKVAEGIVFHLKKTKALQITIHTNIGNSLATVSLGPNLSLKKSQTLHECFESMQIRAYLF